MFSGYFIGAGIIAVLFVLLSAAVFIRNPGRRLNRLFLLFGACLSIWLVSNYLAGNPEVSHGVALVSNKIVFIFAAAVLLAIILLVKELAGRAYSKPLKGIIVLNAISILGSLTPFIVEDVYSDGQTYIIEFGWLSGVYFLTIFINTLYLIISLARDKKGNTPIVKNQLTVIQLSFATTILLLVVINAVLPFIFGYFGLTAAGSLLSSFLFVGIAHAVIRHRLFDVRLAIVRSLAYILTLGALITIFSLVVVVVFNLFAGVDVLARYQHLFYAGMAILFGTTLVPLKKFFDRITNRFFYKDAYDPQQFIDELNANFVKNADVDSLLNNTADILEANLKSGYCVFWLRETQHAPERIIGRAKRPFDAEDLAQVREMAARGRQKVIVTDYLEGPDSQQLAELLRQNDIAALVRLSPTAQPGADEIGYLVLGPKKSGNPYNSLDVKMLDTIANELVIAAQNALRFEEIQQFNIVLQKEIEQATRQLRQTNEKLKQMDETKDEFISLASHQLRTPLTSVKGYLSMVMEGDAGQITPAQRKLLDQAFISSQRMVYLIADLLNVSRLKTGKLVLELQPTNLAELVDGEVSQLKETAASRGLELTYDKPADFPELMLDETKIRQVVMNFIDNAIYYTPSGGHIKVKVSETPETVEVTVTDDGLGVPKADQRHLFSKFFRAGNARKARPDGTGLGLFMAKKVIIAQGGSIIFKSEEGQGSTFGFAFPKPKPA